MARTSILVVMLTAILGVPAVARAQDQGTVGLTMGYPSAIGLLWRVADWVAVRPEFTVSKGSSESTSLSAFGQTTSSLPSDDWQTGVGVSALFYVGRYESLRTYITPRFVYAQSSTSTSLAGTAASSTSDAWSYTASGSFGAEYSLGRHFGVFGEVGLSYTSTRSRQSTVETIVIGVGPAGPTSSTVTLRGDGRLHTLGTRSGAGVIFYF